MDYKNLIAIDIDLNLDYDKISQELLSLDPNIWKHQATSDYTSHWKTISLTKNNMQISDSFRSSKTIDHSCWDWDLTIDVPYTRSVIDSLPIDKIGIVKVLYTDGYIPIHNDIDQNTPDDKTYHLGLSLFPILNDPLTIHNLSLYSRSMFFNDSYLHGYPLSVSKNLTIRIFGKFRYNEFKIKHSYFLEQPI